MNKPSINRSIIFISLVLLSSALIGCGGGECSDLQLEMDLTADNLKACQQELGGTHRKCLEIQAELDRLKQAVIDECLDGVPGSPGETETPEL